MDNIHDCLKYVKYLINYYYYTDANNNELENTLLETNVIYETVISNREAHNKNPENINNKQNIDIDLFLSSYSDYRKAQEKIDINK